MSRIRNQYAYKISKMNDVENINIIGCDFC